MELNPYEAPRELGYRTPQQAVQEARTKDRLLLFVAGAVVYAAMMGFVGVFVVLKLVFHLSDEAVKGVMMATIGFLALVGWAIFFTYKRARRGTAQTASPLP